MTAVLGETKPRATPHTVTSIHEKDFYRCYISKGILWIPSYNDGGVFVAPGGKEVLEADLIKQGVTVVQESLWITSARDGE